MNNIQKIRGRIGARKLTAMVKADAYNHGIATALYIEKAVDNFGVSSSQEGEYLRKLGIKKQIKVVGFVSEEWHKATTFSLIPVVGDIACLEILAKTKKEFAIDLKLDSGMNRIGINNYEDLASAIKIIKNNKNINLVGIASHFSYTDCSNMLVQAERFDKYCVIIENELGLKSKNVAASTALLYGERFLYDEIRAGIAMYGYMPIKTNELALQKAMSITAPIISIKIVKRGERIGYGGLYCAEKDVKIGIVRGGYFDGISRSAQGLTVFVNGEKTFLIGSICMDLCFVLLDDIVAKVGDEVIVLSEENDAFEMAKKCNTIPYEIMTSFKGRIKRIFYL